MGISDYTCKRARTPNDNKWRWDGNEEGKKKFTKIDRGQFNIIKNTQKQQNKRKKKNRRKAQTNYLSISFDSVASWATISPISSRGAV